METALCKQVAPFACDELTTILPDDATVPRLDLSDDLRKPEV